MPDYDQRRPEPLATKGEGDTNEAGANAPMNAALDAMLGAASPLALLAAQSAMGNDAVKSLVQPAQGRASPATDPQAAARMIRESNATIMGDALKHQIANGLTDSVIHTLESITDPDLLEGTVARFKMGGLLSSFSPSAVLAGSLDDDLKGEAALQLTSPERIQALRQIAAMSPEERENLDKDAQARARNVNNALMTPNTGEREVHTNLGMLDPVQAEATRQAYREENFGRRSIYLDMDHSLSGEDLDEAMAGLSGDKVASLAAGLESAVDWDGDSEERVKELLRSSDPATLAELWTGPHAPKLVSAIEAMDGVDKRVVQALSIGDKASADAIHLGSALLPEGLHDGQDEARDPDALMAYLAKLSPEEAKAAVANLDTRMRAAHGEEAPTFSASLEDKFSGFELERARALAEGDTMRARAAQYLEGADGSGTTEKEMEEALADPDLSSKDPVKQSMAWMRRLEMEGWVRQLTGGEEGIGEVKYREYDDDKLQSKDSQLAIEQLIATGRLDSAMRIKRKSDEGDLAGVAQEVEDLSPEERAKAGQDFVDRDWGDMNEFLADEHGPDTIDGVPTEESSPEYMRMVHAQLFGRPQDREPVLRAVTDQQVWGAERSGVTAFIEDVLGSRATDYTDLALEQEMKLAREGGPKAEQDKAHDRFRNGLAVDDKVEDQIADGATSALKAVGKVASVAFPAAAPWIELATSATNIGVNAAFRGERYMEQGYTDDMWQLGVDGASLGAGAWAGNATKGAGPAASALAENASSSVVNSVGTSAVQGESPLQLLESTSGGLHQSVLQTLLGQLIPRGSNLAGRTTSALTQGSVLTAADPKTHKSGTTTWDAIGSILGNAADAHVNQHGSEEDDPGTSNTKNGGP